MSYHVKQTKPVLLVSLALTYPAQWIKTLPSKPPPLLKWSLISARKVWTAYLRYWSIRLQPGLSEKKVVHRKMMNEEIARWFWRF